MSQTTVIVDAPVRRFAGWAGLGFALLVLVQNGVLLMGAPLNDAPMEEVLTFYADNAARITTAAALVPINIVLLITFVAGFTSWAGDTNRASRDWGRLGFAGAIIMASTFLLTTVLQISLVTLVGAETDPSIIELVWVIHAAAFALNMTGLAITLGGLSQTSRLATLGPRWLNTVGALGALCLAVAAVFATQAVDGSPIIFVGLVGFAGWLVWLPVNATLLIRTQSR